MDEDGGDPRSEARGRRAWSWLTLAAAGATTVIVALMLMLSTASRQRDEDLRLQERSYEVMILAASLAAEIAQSEAALGRYVISGNNSIGGIYSDAWRSAGTLLDRLTSATRGDVPQTRRITLLRDAYNVRGNELGSAALRTTYRQNSEALATYYRIRQSSALSRIDRNLGDITRHERSILADRSRAADASLRRANMLVIALSVLGLALIVGGGFLGWTSIEAAARRRREEARSAELEDAVAERTAALLEVNDALTVEMATRETAEAQLRQAQKMEAVGQLTGGIAHDFNNMLAVVLGGVELARRRIEDGSGDPARHLDNALEGANRAAALTKRLLAFARAEPLLPIAADPDTVIAGMADLIDRTLGDRIAVRHLGRADTWRIFVDPHQLENALLNLAVNARDAMPGGGTLTIATAQVALATGDIGDLAAGDYIRIAVSDTGSGIPAEVLDRIFEPFFTTKPVGAGTGLGLSQVFGYVRQSAGEVAVDSVVGTGTTVSLYLPRQSVESSPNTPEQAAESGPIEPLRLLVVEDDPRVMLATVDALRELGHRPVACGDPAFAAALLATNPEINLVLSDVLMPGMTGPELIAELRLDRPGLQALFATGYAGEVDAGAFGEDIVLRKPFTIATLGTAIARVTKTATGAPLATSQAA